MRALFLSTNTPDAAYVRYRALQYFPALESAGIACTVRHVFDPSLEGLIYRPGKGGEKAARLGAGALRRLAHVLSARRYDVVVLLREAFLVGPPLWEALLALEGRRYVLDLDDAVWEGYDSPTYGRLARWLKCAWKTRQVLKMARRVVAGNAYIANYVRGYNDNVTIVPTVVDTTQYRPAPLRDGVPTLGWIGSHSTAQYVAPLLPVLARLARRTRFRLRLVGAGCHFDLPGVELQNDVWREATEIEDVRSFDIGLFPLVENVWSRGKSGFKAVQYGAVGIPTVASPVTTNRDIVLDGETGFWADSPELWHDRLLRLIEDGALRRRLGSAARVRIEAHYSLAAHAPRVVELIRAASD